MKKVRWLTSKEEGFSLIEAIAALLIFTISFAVTGPLFFNQTKSNINNEIKTGAVSLSQILLDDLRLKKALTLGEFNGEKESLGKDYKYKRFICSEQPVVNSDNSVNCPTEADESNPIRHVLFQIKYNENTIYTVETIYTELR